MKPAANREDAIIASVAVGSFAFALYSKASSSSSTPSLLYTQTTNLYLGIFMGITMGLATYFLLRTTRRLEKLRLTLVLPFSILFFLAFTAVILLMGSQYFFAWIGPSRTLIPTILGANWAVGAFLDISSWPTFALVAIGVAPVVVTGFLVGRGWCGWLCAFGGISDLFIRGSIGGRKERSQLPMLREKFLFKGATQVRNPSSRFLPRILFGALDKRVTYVKYGLLAGLAVLVLQQGLKVLYINWWAGFLSLDGRVWELLFIGGGIIFLVFFIILPFLTRRRWCHVICPFGAGLGLLDKYSLFKIRFDLDTCDKCYACMWICPHYAITSPTIEKTGLPTLDCNKCGRCVEICHVDAIEFTYPRSKTSSRPIFLVLSVSLLSFWYVWFVALIVTVASRLLF